MGWEEGRGCVHEGLMVVRDWDVRSGWEGPERLTRNICFV